MEKAGSPSVEKVGVVLSGCAISLIGSSPD